MNTFNSLKYTAVLLPALAMGIPMASASDEKCDCPCDSERTTAVIGSDREHQRAESAKSKANETVRNHNHYVETMPARGYHSDSLVGHDVMNRRDNESVGTVSNLLLDENGQVLALIVSTGGLMGMGQRDLAIAWDQVERKVDGDSITLSVDLTETSLKDAPRYAHR